MVLLIALLSSAILGGIAYHFEVFPYQLSSATIKGFGEMRNRVDQDARWGYILVESDSGKTGTRVINTSGAQPGINLITKMGSDQSLEVILINNDGLMLNQWELNWFDIWPDADHLPAHIKPQSKPGTFIHGAVLLPNGDLIFNYEYCGMLRVDKNGGVVWKLPYSTHHSLELDEHGFLWTCGLLYLENADAGAECELIEKQVIVKLDLDGNILNEWHVEDLLIASNLRSYLYLVNRKCDYPQDLHLNDVDPIPDSLTGEFFQSGDILFSLRNVNSVFVFNTISGQVRKAVTGSFIGQHDPDAIDDGLISVFDNRNGSATKTNSRIILVETGDSVSTYYDGNEADFFSEKLGNHQWLGKGHLLIAESQMGRAFELDNEREVVWEYINRLSDGRRGFIIDVHRYPKGYAKAFE